MGRVHALLRQVDRQVDRQVVRQVVRQVDREVVRQVDRQVVRQVVRQMVRQVVRQVGGRAPEVWGFFSIPLNRCQFSTTGTYVRSETNSDRVELK